MIVRKIDDLGRVVLPAEMRHTLNIVEGDELNIVLDPYTETILIQPAASRCALCGTGREPVVQVGVRHICKVCLEQGTVAMEAAK